MDGTTLDTVIEEKDLGVLIDEKLKFHQYVSAAVLMDNQILGIIKRMFDALDKELLPIGVQCRATKVFSELIEKDFIAYICTQWNTEEKGET